MCGVFWLRISPVWQKAPPRRYNSSIDSIRESKVNAVTTTANKTWMCLICGWLYDEAAGAPEHGIAPGTLWADVPMNWTCPECGARKEDFEMVEL
jgi:rubredoxin